MQTMLMAVAAMTAIGVDVGWQPTANGELEYIIQIEPHQLKNLKPGDVIEVGVRPQLRHVRRYKIVVGEGELPRNAGGTDLVPEQPAAVTKSLKSGSQDPSPGLPLDTNPERSVVVDNNTRGGPPKASAEPATDNGETAVSPAEKTAPELYVIPNLSEELRNKDLLVPPPYPDHFNSTNAETESRAVAQPLPAASHVPVPRATPRTTDLETLPPAGFGPSSEDSATISGGEGRLESENVPSASGLPARNLNPVFLDPGAKNNSDFAARPEGAPAAYYTRTPQPAANVLPSPKSPSPPAAPEEPATEPPGGDSPKPWMLFTVTLLALFASIGGNVYLGWMNWDMRQRFRDLVRKLKLGEARG